MNRTPRCHGIFGFLFGHTFRSFEFLDFGFEYFDFCQRCGFWPRKVS